MAKLGVIGKPSDWLIASDVDYKKVNELFDIELVDIDIKELIDKSKSEVNRTLDKVFKAYKHTPEARRSLESKLFNKALKMVSDKHPEWGIADYEIKEK